MNDQIGYAILAVGLLFVIAAMFSLGRGRKRKESSQTTARDHVERARQKQGVRDELEALMVDINRMARDLGAQLDAKVVRIEEATRQADERIARLDALQRSINEPAPYAAAGHTPPTTDPAAHDLPDVPDMPATHVTHTQADPLTREVYALADTGLGPNDIAEQLGEHVGKVELILALRNG